MPLHGRGGSVDSIVVRPSCGMATQLHLLAPRSNGRMGPKHVKLGYDIDERPTLRNLFAACGPGADHGVDRDATQPK